MDDRTPPTTHRHASRLGAVMGLLVVLVLLAGGPMLAHALQHMSQIQDYAMSGRTNCSPIEPSAVGI